MPNKTLSLDEVKKLPPMLFGVIRWKKNIGSPSGDACSGFRIRVEERTPLEFRDAGGHIEVIPGTGTWHLVTDSAPCSPAPDEGDYHVVTFRVPDVHLNGFSGGEYKIIPELTGAWNNSLFSFLFGFRQLDQQLPRFVKLTKDSHIQTVEFEVIRRPRLFRS